MYKRVLEGFVAYRCSGVGCQQEQLCAKYLSFFCSEALCLLSCLVCAYVFGYLTVFSCLCCASWCPCCCSVATLAVGLLFYSAVSATRCCLTPLVIRNTNLLFDVLMLPRSLFPFPRPTKQLTTATSLAKFLCPTKAVVRTFETAHNYADNTNTYTKVAVKPRAAALSRSRPCITLQLFCKTLRHVDSHVSSS